MEQTNILTNSNADTDVGQLVKKNEKLAEAVKKLKTFIKASNEDFEKKEDEIKKKEGEIELLESVVDVRLPEAPREESVQQEHEAWHIKKLRTFFRILTRLKFLEKQEKRNF